MATIMFAIAHAAHKQTGHENMSNLALYKLSEKEQTLQDRIQNILVQNEGEVTEQVERLENELELTVDNIAEKLDGYYQIMRNMASHEEALREEAERLEERAEKQEKAREWLEGNIHAFMHERGLDSLQTTHTEFKLNSVGGQKPIELLAPDSGYPYGTKKRRAKIEVDEQNLPKERCDDFFDDLFALCDEYGLDAGVTIKAYKSRLRDNDDADELIRYKSRKKRLKY